MRLRFRATGCSLLILAGTLPAFASPHVRRGPTAPHAAKTHATKTANHSVLTHISMAPARATEIQTALIKAGYLSGTPTGSWDASSQAAMEKLQADNGWQTKIVPDSRAIIKLGLGPSATPPPAEPTQAPTSTLESSNKPTNQIR